MHFSDPAASPGIWSGQFTSAVSMPQLRFQPQKYYATTIKYEP